MVSPSEVERALTGVDGVERAAVVPVPAPDGGTRLAAYVVPDAGATPSAWQIRRDLATRLPSTMIPAAVVLVEALPFTARGKIDRAVAPCPRRLRRLVPIASRSGRERELAELFGEVLGLDDVGLDDDFFELGGDSLAVLELLAGINERFGVELSATAVLASPTVTALATRLVRRRRTAATVVALVSATGGDPVDAAVLRGRRRFPRGVAPAARRLPWVTIGRVTACRREASRRRLDPTAASKPRRGAISPRSAPSNRPVPISSPATRTEASSPSRWHACSKRLASASRSLPSSTHRPRVSC